MSRRTLLGRRQFLDAQSAVAHALRLLEEGADILDIGGESTRPGSAVMPDEPGGKYPVTEDEELRRVMPVIEGIRKERPNALISIDTYKAGVARRAVEAGGGDRQRCKRLQWDASMARTCADLGVAWS